LQATRRRASACFCFFFPSVVFVLVRNKEEKNIRTLLVDIVKILEEKTIRLSLIRINKNRMDTIVSHEW